MGSPFFKPDAAGLYASPTIDSSKFPKPVQADAVGVMVSMMGSHFQRKID